MNNTTSMQKYKNEFAIRFADLMQKQQNYWKNYREKHIKSLYTTYSFLYIIAVITGFVPFKRELPNYSLTEHSILSIMYLIGAILGAIAIANSNYQKDIKKILFPQLIKVFSNNITYIPQGVKCEEVNVQEFKDSELFKYPVTYVDDKYEDKIKGEYNNVPFAILETYVGGSVNVLGKEQHKDLFKGIAMKFTMSKEIKNRVLIYSKTLKNYTPKGYEKVTFEHEEFNRKYNVFVKQDKNSSGQIEARYLFNTAFINRFMQLQTSFKVDKMYCSVFENKMLILLQTNKDLFEMNHFFGKIDDVKQYEHLFNEFASVLSFIDVLNLSSKTHL